MSTVCAQEIVVKDIPSLDKLPVKAIHRIFQDSDGYISVSYTHLDVYKRQEIGDESVDFD